MSQPPGVFNQKVQAHLRDVQEAGLGDPAQAPTPRVLLEQAVQLWPRVLARPPPRQLADRHTAATPESAELRARGQGGLHSGCGGEPAGAEAEEPQHRGQPDLPERPGRAEGAHRHRFEGAKIKA